jgi:hypothetical protein
MQLRLMLTDSCLYFLYTDVKWCVLLDIITLLYKWVFFWRLRLLFFFIYPLLCLFGMQRKYLAFKLLV